MKTKNTIIKKALLEAMEYGFEKRDKTLYTLKTLKNFFLKNKIDDLINKINDKKEKDL